MLSEEQQNELAAALEGLNLGEEPAAQAPEPEPVEVQEEVSEPVHESEAPEEVALEDSGDDEEVEETGHNVPYSRFSKVIAAKNQYADEADTLRQEVERLKAKEQELETLRRYNIQQPQQQYQEEESYNYDDTDPYDQRLQMLEGRLAENEREAKIREHMNEMEQQIAVIQQEHPNVDPIALLQHVQNNPDADLMELATSEAARVAEMRESVIAEYLEANPHLQTQAPATPPDVPPEVSNKSNTGSRGFAGARKPTTWEDAHAQARKAIEAAWTG
tara:strand:- start:280 stop:1104 length:825 start_codon:yes stop_codon:yes gene_type:complete